MPKKPSTVRLFIPVTHETHGQLQELATRLGVKPNQAYGIAIAYGARMMLRSLELQERFTPEQIAGISKIAGMFGAEAGRDELIADTKIVLDDTEKEQKPKPRPKRKKAT